MICDIIHRPFGNSIVREMRIVWIAAVLSLFAQITFSQLVVQLPAVFIRFSIFFYSVAFVSVAIEARVPQTFQAQNSDRIGDGFAYKYPTYLC